MLYLGSAFTVPATPVIVYSVVVVSGSAPVSASVLAAEALSRQNGPKVFARGVSPRPQCAECSAVSDIPLFSAVKHRSLLDSVGK